jgi:hypothetical protein
MKIGNLPIINLESRYPGAMSLLNLDEIMKSHISGGSV